MQVSLISKYRSHLMGVAMIWVILYHFYGQVNQADITNVFFVIGNGGVDIFLFLSGLGLVFSCVKSAKEINYKEFIKKKFLRIIPTYYIVIVFFGILLHLPILVVIQQMLIVGFFLPTFNIFFYDWYIPSLLVLYAVFPLFYKFFIKQPKKVTLFAVIIGVLLTIPLIYIQKGTVILFFSRIPVFFIGAYFGYLIARGYKLSKTQTSVTIVFFVLFMIFELALTYLYPTLFLRKTALSHLPFMFITPGLCLVLSAFFEKIQNTVIGVYLLKVLLFIGVLSLQIYLIHMAFYHSLKFVPVAISLLITIAAADYLNYLVNKLMAKMEDKSKVRA